MLDTDLSHFTRDISNRNYIQKKSLTELISPINYTWKELFRLMNKIKIIWHMKKFDNSFTNDSQSLNKYIYSNLKYCNNVPNLRNKNNIIENEINSMFQTKLFDYFSEEIKLFKYYDELFERKEYTPKTEQNECLFGEFVVEFKNMLYNIQKNKRSMRQLKKLRWYIIMDDDNFFEDEVKKDNCIFNISNGEFLFDFSKEIQNINDSFDEEELEIIYNEYKNNEKNMDNLDEIIEKNIINDKLIDKLLKNENNSFFYIIKLIYLSFNIFCKTSICHLLNSFSSSNDNEFDDGKLLINEYLKTFNNYVDTCLLINKKCLNLNIAMNYLYKSLFENYPNFPKFSIFRMCIRIWFSEANTYLIGKNTLLEKIRKNITSVFSCNLKEELFNKMENKLKNNCNIFSKSANYNKEKSFSLSSSYMLFKSDNESFKDKLNYYSPSSLGFVNDYDNSDKQYKIMEKGLSIINDTFSNEYSVHLLFLSSIDTNSFFYGLVNDFNNSIKYYIDKVFKECISDKTFDEAKNVIDNIFLYFDNYFFKMKIIPKLKQNIYESAHINIKKNILEYIKKIYLNNVCGKESNIFTSNNIISSAKTNFSSSNNLKSSSIFELNPFDLENDNNSDNENAEINNEEEIVDYIMKNTSYDENNQKLKNEIKIKIEEINKEINIYDLFNSNENWYEQQMSKIQENDLKIIEELCAHNFSCFTFNKIKRYLLSYSLQYDWDFIKRAKNLQKFIGKIEENENDDIEMIGDGNNNNNELGLNYFNDENNNEVDFNYFNNLNNIGNNNNNLGGINLKNSFFGY